MNIQIITSGEGYFVSPFDREVSEHLKSLEEEEETFTIYDLGHNARILSKLNSKSFPEEEFLEDKIKKIIGESERFLTIYSDRISEDHDLLTSDVVLIELNKFPFKISFLDYYVLLLGFYSSTAFRTKKGSVFLEESLVFMVETLFMQFKYLVGSFQDYLAILKDSEKEKMIYSLRSLVLGFNPYFDVQIYSNKGRVAVSFKNKLEKLETAPETAILVLKHYFEAYQTGILRYKKSVVRFLDKKNRVNKNTRL